MLSVGAFVPSIDLGMDVFAIGTCVTVIINGTVDGYNVGDTDCVLVGDNDGGLATGTGTVGAVGTETTS